MPDRPSRSIWSGEADAFSPYLLLIGVRFLCPSGDGDFTAQESLSASPRAFEELPAAFTIQQVSPDQRFTIGGYTITPTLPNHPDDAMFGPAAANSLATARSGTENSLDVVVPDAAMTSAERGSESS